MHDSIGKHSNGSIIINKTQTYLHKFMLRSSWPEAQNQSVKPSSQSHAFLENVLQ